MVNQSSSAMSIEVRQLGCSGRWTVQKGGDMGEEVQPFVVRIRKCTAHLARLQVWLEECG
jgi:hypothetical protein